MLAPVPIGCCWNKVVEGLEGIDVNDVGDRVVVDDDGDDGEEDEGEDEAGVERDGEEDGCEELVSNLPSDGPSSLSAIYRAIPDASRGV